MAAGGRDKGGMVMTRQLPRPFAHVGQSGFAMFSRTLNPSQTH